MSQNKIKDESKDKEYFTITPQLVWALSRTPYDLALWNVVKMIAGDDNECILSTPDLATLAMMSTGKVSDCRKYLLETGLLEGELRKDPGYPQPVWHLTIPDLWIANVKWRQEIGDKLRARIEYKRQQRESFHQVKASPDEKGMIPDEKGMIPDEKGLSPDETKDIQKDIQTEIQKGNPSDSPEKSKGDPLLFEKERETLAKRAEAGANFAVPGGDFPLGDHLITAACARLGRSEPQGDKRKSARAFFEKALQDERLLQGDMAMLEKAVKDWLDPEGDYAFYLPQYEFSIKHKLALRHFEIVLSKAKKQTAATSAHRRRDVEATKASLAALDERRAARPPPVEGDWAWEAAKRELQLQTRRHTYETWIRDTVGLGREDGVYTVAVADPLKRDWLENRLKTTAERTLVGILGEAVEVQFEVANDVDKPI